MNTREVSTINGIRLIETKSVRDARGAFVKFHPVSEFEDPLDSIAFSLNPNLGTIRGMHFQIEPFAEEKLITCVQGSIFDVIIDLRPKSKTFGKWTSFKLSASNSTQIYIPKGMAHGFQTLMPDSIVLYSISNRYIPESAYSIDPLGDININWPLGITAISDRDSGGLSTSIAAQMYADSLTS